MLSQVKKMHDGKGNEMIWLLEHNDIYTGGTSSKQSDLKNTKNIKISKTNRGGQWTWHGPGQRIVYFVLDLNMRNKDVRWFVNKLEQLIINTLLDFNINSERRKNLPGVWVQNKKNSKNVFKQALKYMPGGVNSPVRSFSAVKEDPRFIKRSFGAYIEDIDNNI